MRELADFCIGRTQVLAESVFVLSEANKQLTDRLTQHSSFLNEIVGQVQYLAASERQINSNMEQGGWNDRYLTELGQRAAVQDQRLLKNRRRIRKDQ